MANNAAIENFINKYRIAVKSQAKDMRITTEEAADLVASIALINSDREAIQQLEKAIVLLAGQIRDNGIKNTTEAPVMDGGGFKVQ